MLAENIKSYRKKCGYSQEDLARKADITYSALSKIEAGYVQNPRILTVQKIARAHEVTIDDLMKEQSTIYKAPNEVPGVGGAPAPAPPA